MVLGGAVPRRGTFSFIQSTELLTNTLIAYEIEIQSPHNAPCGGHAKWVASIRFKSTILITNIWLRQVFFFSLFPRGGTLHGAKFKKIHIMSRKETFKVNDETGKVTVISQEEGCKNYHQYSFTNMRDAVNFCEREGMHPQEY